MVEHKFFYECEDFKLSDFICNYLQDQSNEFQYSYKFKVHWDGKMRTACLEAHPSDEFKSDTKGLSKSTVNQMLYDQIVCSMVAMTKGLIAEDRTCNETFITIGM